MTFSLLMIVLCGFLIIIALIMAIIGGIKKRKNLLVSGIVLFIVAIGGALFSAYQFAKSTAEYVKSDSFQEDLKNGLILSERLQVLSHLEQQKVYLKLWMMKPLHN